LGDGKNTEDNRGGGTSRSSRVLKGQPQIHRRTVKEGGGIKKLGPS